MPAYKLKLSGFSLFAVPHFWVSGFTNRLSPGIYGLTSLSEKTRKANHLLMSMQGQAFLLNYFNTSSLYKDLEIQLRLEL